MPITSHKGTWTTIVTTTVLCAAVFGFFYKQTTDLYENRLAAQKTTIESLERENKTLAESGPIPEAVCKLKGQIEELRTQLRPLTMVTKIDQISGRCDMGMMSFGTTLTTDLIEAQKLVQDKKYDLALAKADEMQKELPGFPGADYIRFCVNKDKGFQDQAAEIAEEVLRRIPDDTRIKDVYMFLGNYYLEKGNKAKAEEVIRAELNLWPDDAVLSDSFRLIFGYTPTPRKSETTHKGVESTGDLLRSEIHFN